MTGIIGTLIHRIQLTYEAELSLLRRQTMLDLHIRNVDRSWPVDKLGYRLMAHWVKSMVARGKAPKTIHNVHGLISAAKNTAEMLGHISRNPCRGVQLPNIEKAEAAAMFLTHAEFSLIMEGMGERYKTFTNFLVMTGTRFGEATVADVDFLSKAPTIRTNKACKRDGQNKFYIGATKTGAGKRTIGLNPARVELLIPLVASRPVKELVFTTPKGERIYHKLYWDDYWLPAVRTAEALQAGADATGRSITAFQR